MDPEDLIARAPSGGRVCKEWPQLFSESRKPTDDRPFIDSLREHDPINDGVRLFMQHYDDDKISLDVEIVARFCQDVHLYDFNDQFISKKGTAWLNDHAIPPVSELAGHDVRSHVSSTVATDARNQNTGLAGHNTREILIGDVGDGCDITEALGNVPLVLNPRVPTQPRAYEECLTARALHNCLREKRFNHATLEDADRRLIRIADPDSCDMLALTETVPEYQKSAVQAILWQYLALQTSLKVIISSSGYRVFHLELHLPYFALRRTLKDLRNQGSRTRHRRWMDLSFLAHEIEEGIWGIHEAQISLTICGTDNSRWVAYCLEDTSFDADREIGDDECLPEWRSDQISLGKLDANLPLWDAREYFLAICLIRTKQIVRETRDLVRVVEASYERNACQPLFSTCRSEDSATSEWTDKMLQLLSILIRDISKKTDSWTRFADKDIGYFGDTQSTFSPSSKTHVQQTLAALDTEFDQLKSFEKQLRDIEERCEKLATRLDHRLVCHGSKNGEFTFLVISPIVIVASIFAIPTPVVSFERNTLSFLVSIAFGMISLNLVMLLRGGWLRRQRWWDKLSRRARGAWQGDQTITIQKESGPRVLRRRSTHASLSRDK